MMTEPEISPRSTRSTRALKGPRHDLGVLGVLGVEPDNGSDEGSVVEFGTDEEPDPSDVRPQGSPNPNLASPNS